MNSVEQSVVSTVENLVVARVAKKVDLWEEKRVVPRVDSLVVG